MFDRDDWYGVFFFILYNQYGGSGLNLSYSDLMEMEIDEILWFYKQLGEMREKESSELQRATQK